MCSLIGKSLTWATAGLKSNLADTKRRLTDGLCVGFMRLWSWPTPTWFRWTSSRTNSCWASPSTCCSSSDPRSLSPRSCFRAVSSHTQTRSLAQSCVKGHDCCMLGRTWRVTSLRLISESFNPSSAVCPHRCCRCCPRCRHRPSQADCLSQRRLGLLRRHVAGSPRDYPAFWHHPERSEPAGLQRGPPVLGGGGEWEDLLGAGAHLPEHPTQGPRGGVLAGPRQRVLVCGIL